MSWERKIDIPEQAQTAFADIMSEVRRSTANLEQMDQDYVLAKVLEQATPHFPLHLPDGRLHITCPSRSAWHHARGFFDTEPETLHWIDQFAPGEVFWDIGAGIGIFALYAAFTRGTQVLAFEPGAASYGSLNRNVEINQLQNQIHCYCLAFSGTTLLHNLNLFSTEAGSIFNTFGEPLDYMGQKLEPVFRQGMLGFAVNDFVKTFQPPIPNHIKLDVDGIEDEILASAGALLENPRLQTILSELVEGNDQRTNRILDSLAAAGFRTSPRNPPSKGQVPNAVFVRQGVDFAPDWPSTSGF